MLSQRLVAFCAGALSAALLSGLAHWLPSFQVPESGLSSHSDAALCADGVAAGTAVASAVAEPIRYETASGSGTNPSVGDGVITPGLSADDAAPVRGVSNGDGQTCRREDATQTNVPADAACSAVPCTDGAPTEAAVASAFAPENPDDSASGSGAKQVVEDAVSMLELPADRSVVVRQVLIVDPQTDPEDATQANVPADTTSSAVPSDDQDYAGFPTNGGSRPDAAVDASPRAPTGIPFVDLADDAFGGRAIDIALDDSSMVGAGSSGSGSEAFSWPGESMIDRGDLPGQAVGGSSTNTDPRNAAPDPTPFVEDAIGFGPAGFEQGLAPDLPPDVRTIAEVAAGREIGPPASSRKPTLGLAVIPEPGTAALLASGLGGLALLRRRRASAGSRRG